MLDGSPMGTAASSGSAASAGAGGGVRSSGGLRSSGGGAGTRGGSGGVAAATCTGSARCSGGGSRRATLDRPLRPATRRLGDLGLRAVAAAGRRRPFVVKSVAAGDHHVVHVVVGEAVAGGVEEHRLADAAVALAVQHVLGDFRGERQALPLLHRLRHNPRRELVFLAYDAAHGVGKFAGFDTVHDDRADRQHALRAGAVGLEIHDPRHAGVLAFSRRKAAASCCGGERAERQDPDGG